MTFFIEIVVNVDMFRLQPLQYIYSTVSYVLNIICLETSTRASQLISRLKVSRNKTADPTDKGVHRPMLTLIVVTG